MNSEEKENENESMVRVPIDYKNIFCAFLYSIGTCDCEIAT